MQHTYLRYECSDSFGLTTHPPTLPGSTQILTFLPSSLKRPIIALTTLSQITAFDLRRGDSVPHFKLHHPHISSDGSGSQKALNNDFATCVDSVSTDATVKICVGYMDGSVRVFDLDKESCLKGDFGVCNSIISREEQKTFEPLLLNGHKGSPIRVVAFEKSKGGLRLASGGSDGSIIVWDLVSETGLFRLLGHKGGISGLDFIQRGSEWLLISSSLDGLVKVWDLEGQCCTQTIANHRGEVWGMDYANVGGDRWRLITGGSDGQLRLFEVANKIDIEPMEEKSSALDETLLYMGSVPREESNEKISFIQFHPSFHTHKLVGVLSHNSRKVEIYYFRSKEETDKKRKRRLRRRREKLSKKDSEEHISIKKKRGILDDDEEEEEEQKLDDPDNLVDSSLTKASDEMELIGVLKASNKVKGFAFAPYFENGGGVRIVLALSNNAVEIHSIPKHTDSTAVSPNDMKRLTTFDFYGHPTGIRSISLTSDDNQAVTISKGAMKVWNVPNRSCITSLPLHHEQTNKTTTQLYALCCLFLPSNSHVLIGTREGHLLIVDTASADICFIEESAHESAIWAMDIRPDRMGVVTGSADNQVKFWDFDQAISSVHETDTLQPSLVHTRTLKMSDDITSLRYTPTPSDPTKTLLAISTLDSTVQIFFADTLKFFLSLYGHKLPVLTIDISSDETILISGSADKTIKIWGLDFGDAHRTLYGHQDSVTDLKFVKNTHYFFSASKDKSLRYWDGDRFECILVLEGHGSEVNCLAIGRTGGFVLSGGMDRQVRVWERTKDIVFLEEEREKELEQIFDRVDDTADDRIGRQEGEEILPQSEAAVKKSVLSVASGDRIMEAIEIADKEMKDMFTFQKSSKAGEKKSPNMLLIGLEPPQYILWVLKSIKSVELEQSLLVLPLSHMERLVFYLISLLRKGMGVEICSKVAVFLIKTHQNQIITTKTLATPLRELRKLIKRRLTEYRNAVGFNLAAMQIIAKVANERKNAFVTDEAPVDIWAGLGLGSDVAAALESKRKRPKKV